MTERDDNILFQACNPDIQVYTGISKALNGPRDWTFSFTSITPEERANRNRSFILLPETVGERRKRMLFENMEISLQQIFWEMEVVGILRKRLHSSIVLRVLNSVMETLEESRTIIVEHYFSDEFEGLRGKNSTNQFEPSRVKKYQRGMLQRLSQDLTERASVDSDKRKSAIQADLQTIGQVCEYFEE